VQSPARSYGSHCVARILGSPFLRLEQVDVSATRDVEGMSTRTEQPPLLAHQRHVAAADGAEEHASSVTDGGRAAGALSPNDSLRLERQDGVSGGPAVNQLQRPNALCLPPVFEEKQSCLRQGAISFQHGGSLNALFHRAP